MSHPKSYSPEFFKHHTPTPEEVLAIEAIRHAADRFAQSIDNYVHDGPDKTAAIRKVREAMMTANAGIVLAGKV